MNEPSLVERAAFTLVEVGESRPSLTARVPARVLLREGLS